MASAIQIPGGCQDCDAFQTLDETSPGIYVLAVHHDDTCPQLRAQIRKGNR
ncbi:hypothetical protein [Demequina sp. NBRC 110053]|uniref:hypothetical protein n=1 Tax=Demequina sp. NBRC 110053 TaxID=1570342 RepID=UPI0013562E96|nr:hypothetical protein [Demequina sp. NBRC 110053]